MLPREDAVEVLHLFHNCFGGVSAASFNLQKPQASKGYDTGEEMTPDLVVCPVEYRIYLNMTTCLAHPELLLNSTSVQARADNLFSGPVMVVGNNARY